MRLAIVLCALIGLAAGPAGAADLAAQQPSYTRIAAQCGEDPSRPSFSSADYASAMADAAKAVREAARKGERTRIEAIQNSVARLKECLEEEARKFYFPPIVNCRQFLTAYQGFLGRAGQLVRAGKITSADRERHREHFRQPAEACVRDMMTKCIDPTKTSHVDFVIDAMRAAADFGFIWSYERQEGVERFLTRTNPMFLRMSFCTDTDYACKGNPDACQRRIRAIKAIMQTYMSK